MLKKKNDDQNLEILNFFLKFIFKVLLPGPGKSYYLSPFP
jgi:hypothetical protein